MRTETLARLLQLAGLRESIANDPKVNTEVEARLVGDGTADKDIWLDMLDIVLRAKLARLANSQAERHHSTTQSRGSLANLTT